MTLSRSSTPGIHVHTTSGSVTLSTENVIETTRCTVVGQGSVRVSTVEHLSAACTALGVTALDVALEGPELPIGDGASLFWMDALAELGFNRESPVWRDIPSAVEVSGTNGAFIGIYPATAPTVSVLIQFPDVVVGTMAARWVPGEEHFRGAVAPARTFGFRHEVDALIAAGLGRGGTLENCIVVEETGYAGPLRMDREPAIHKLLDLVGDLGLCGWLPTAQIVAVRPSHGLNVTAARELSALMRK
ncbi:MAG: UDP-3-O-acyl-N-acetylglucosamine deacetylase [Armatimonadota bacterium]